MNTKEYQQFAYDSLRQIFRENRVKKEWDVAKASQDDFTRKIYCPRLDIAIGPFNIDGNLDQNITRIEDAFNNYKDILDRLISDSQYPDGDFEAFFERRNKNPRCFLAIEIENSGTSKHMLGNIANVSILGSLGIVVPFNEKQLSLCKRIREYLRFASAVKKTKVIFENILVIDKENFLQVLADREQL